MCTWRCMPVCSLRLPSKGKKVKVKWSRYRPRVAQRVGRGIALIFHDRGSRRGCVFSCRPRPPFTPGKDPVPILQEAVWAPRPVWTGGKSRPHRDFFFCCPKNIYFLQKVQENAEILQPWKPLTLVNRTNRQEQISHSAYIYVTGFDVHLLLTHI